LGLDLRRDAFGFAALASAVVGSAAASPGGSEEAVVIDASAGGSEGAAMGSSIGGGGGGGDISEEEAVGGGGGGGAPACEVWDGFADDFATIGTNSPGRQLWGWWRMEMSRRNRSAWPHVRQIRVPRGTSPRALNDRDAPVIPVFSSFAQTKSVPLQFEQTGATGSLSGRGRRAPGP
jgi:hypothetical protein